MRRGPEYENRITALKRNDFDLIPEIVRRCRSRDQNEVVNDSAKTRIAPEPDNAWHMAAVSKVVSEVAGHSSPIVTYQHEVVRLAPAENVWVLCSPCRRILVTYSPNSDPRLLAHQGGLKIAA